MSKICTHSKIHLKKLEKKCEIGYNFLGMEGFMKVSSMNQQEKVQYMLSEPVPHLVCQMAVPTIISMLVTSFYNMADTFL